MSAMRVAASRDVWEDAPVLLYLVYKCYDPSASESEKSRIRKRARRHVWKQGQLFRRGCGGNFREVPIIQERFLLAVHAHRLSGHSGQKTVLRMLREKYFWRHMAKDVQLVTASCPFCQHISVGGARGGRGVGTNTHALVPEESTAGGEDATQWTLVVSDFKSVTDSASPSEDSPSSSTD